MTTCFYFAHLEKDSLKLGLRNACIKPVKISVIYSKPNQYPSTQSSLTPAISPFLLFCLYKVKCIYFAVAYLKRQIFDDSSQPWFLTLR